MSALLKPGELAPWSGQYTEVNPQGEAIGPYEITAIEGKPLPPTTQPGNAYKSVDPTKHKT